jgi:hypothetical protein
MIQTETTLGRFATREKAEASLQAADYQAYPSDHHETHYRHENAMLVGSRGETPYWPEWRVVRVVNGQFAVISVINRHWKEAAQEDAED